MSKIGHFARRAILATISLSLSFSPAVSAEVKIPNASFPENSILFYDPCNGASDSGNISEPFFGPNANASGHWDGRCNMLSSNNAAWLSSQIQHVQNIAKKNNLPWELIIAQTFAESGGGKKEVCPFNPLGLKPSSSSEPSCNGRHRSFNSYAEAYQYYIDHIKSIRNIKGKFPNDPYSAIEYIQYGSGAPYAQCSKQEYIDNNQYGCGGHKLGDPTPIYVNSVSAFICGIQKWAQANGQAISSVNYSNFTLIDGSTLEIPEGEMPLSSSILKPNRCDKNDITESSPGDTEGLERLLLEWAWPTYRGRGFTERMPAYANYINTRARYKGGCNGVDCGAFVSNIIIASGWDPNYIAGNTNAQRSWLAKNWQQVNGSNLQLGDVGIKPGHVILYVGNIPGFNSNTASASLCDRAPMAGSPGEKLSNYTWYRKR